MSDYITSHYDLNEHRGKQLLVLDTFKSMSNAIQNDVIPGSREDVAISGIENPASTLKSTGNNYTTIPLRPVSKDVNFLYNNYLHGRFKVKYVVKSFSDSAGTTAADLQQNVNAAISLINTACFFSRIQLMCGNTVIWQNQFQRQEAICGQASLPQEIVETNAEYLTCSKVLKHAQIPGTYVTLSSSNKTATGVYGDEFVLDFTVDMNHLTPLLSNIPFTCIETGDLRLRLFMENVPEAFSITPIPEMAAMGNVNYHVISPQPHNKLFSITHPSTQALASAENTIAAGTTGSTQYLTFDITEWSAIDFGLEVVQSNFSIKESSREALRNYIKEDDTIVIPTQTWSTALSTSLPTNSNGEVIFQVSAFNIYLLAFLFPYDNSWPCYYPTVPLKNIDIQLNSKSVNYIPYNCIDSRVMKDTIQAFVNDDKYGCNEMLIDSLQMPLKDGSYDATVYLSRFDKTGNNVVSNPNMFVMAKGLSPPDCFEKGYCYASSNPQSTQIRLRYTLESGLETGAANTLNANKSITTTNSPVYCMALQDCCLVLNYNRDNNVAQSGSIVYASPEVM